MGASGLSGCRDCDYDVCTHCLNGRCFDVHMQLSENESLGLDLCQQKACCPKLLRIRTVDNGGAAARWNACILDCRKADALSTTAETVCELSPGDLVYQVNGVADDTERMLEALTGAQDHVRLSIFRKENFTTPSKNG